MIRRITDKERIPEILQLAKKITIWDFDLQELAVYLEATITSPAVLVLLDDEKRCFSVSSVFRDMITPYAVISFAWSDPHYPETGKRELQLIKDWARSLGISVIRIAVRKNVKAWKKKYGFKVDGVLLKLEVDNG